MNVDAMILCVFLIAGCDDRTYKGRRVAEWVATTRDTDRTTAANALNEIIPARGVPEFNQIAENLWRSNNISNQMFAMRNPACAAAHGGEIAAAVESAISSAAYSGDRLFVDALHLDQSTLEALLPTIKKYCSDAEYETCRTKVRIMK